MPDLSEIENTLVGIVAQAVYPNGTAADSSFGAPARVYRGWPIPANLDADLKKGIVNISIFPLEPEQNVTRYSGGDWEELPSPKLTLTLTVDGQNVGVGGRICCPANAAVVVNGKPFVYPIQATDTLTDVATALATLIGTMFSASSSGPVITVPEATTLEARVGAVGEVVQEVKRQKKGFRITLWCPSPDVRDAAAAVLDPVLSDLTFVSLTDGTSGRIRYDRTHISDRSQKSWLYRRDFDYSVEYATTIVQKAAEVVAPSVTVTGSAEDIETTNP